MPLLHLLFSRTQNFLSIKNKTEKICKLAVSLNGLLLAHIPEDKKTLELCMIAMEQNKAAEKFVPDKYKEKLF